MSGAKHTPGPWHCRFDAFDEVLYVTSDARLKDSMAEICHVSVGYNEPFETEQQANARLIAAAPELLAELRRDLQFAREMKGLIEALKGKGWVQHTMAETRIEMLTAAIAKAEAQP